MLGEQKNRPSLRRSISFAGITKHSGNEKRLRNQRFKHQPREAASLLRDNPHFISHPYKTQKENLHVLQTEPKKSLLKNHRHSSMKVDSGDMRILDSDLSLNESLKSVLCIADRLQHSLNIKKDKRDTKDETDIHSPKNWLLKGHKKENMENRSKGQTASPLGDNNINDHTTSSLHVTNVENDEDEIISVPCLGDELCFAATDFIEKATEQRPSVISENEKVQQTGEQFCGEEQKEYCSSNVAIDNSSGFEEQLHKLETTPMFDFEYLEQDFDFSIILRPKSPSFIAPPDRKMEDRKVDDLYCSTDIDPDLRDLLCIESPTCNSDANRRSTPDDYRQALAVQDNNLTCLLCGSNLEINPFDIDNFTVSSNDIHDFCYGSDDNNNFHTSPCYSHCNDSIMFCPLCCENRLVQNYNWMHKS